METNTLTHKAILETVQTWPTSRRLQLVQEILQDVSIALEEPVESTPKDTLSKALGLLAIDPPPTDEEVERILMERRLEKYG